MKPSQQIWEFLQKEDMGTRGEAEEYFAEALGWIIEDETNNSLSDGEVIDSLSSALDYIIEKEPKFMVKFDEYMRELEEN